MGFYCFVLGATLGSAVAFVGLVLATFVFGADARLTILAAGIGAVAIPSVVFALGIAYDRVRNRASSQWAPSHLNLAESLLLVAGFMIAGLSVCFGGRYGTMLMVMLWS